MEKHRRELFGFRDYLGVSLDEIISDLVSMYQASIQDRETLLGYKREIESNNASFEAREGVIGSIEYWAGLIADFASEFLRVSDDIKTGVESRHIVALKKIYDRVIAEEGRVSKFDASYLYPFLSDENFGLTLERISEALSALFYYYRNLSGIYGRLGDFVSDAGKRSPDLDKLAKPLKIKPLDIEPISSWGDVCIRFVSATEVWIRVGSKNIGTLNYAELGFYDGRNTRVADRIWKIILVSFGKERGEIAYQDVPAKARANLKASISELRRRLRILFRTKEDPFFPYKRKDSSYRAKFNIAFNNEEDIPL